jgi:hypothetical protein
MKALEAYRLFMPDELTWRLSNLMSVPNARNKLPKLARIFHPPERQCSWLIASGVQRKYFGGAYASRRVLIRRPAGAVQLRSAERRLWIGAPSTPSDLTTNGRE